MPCSFFAWPLLEHHLAARIVIILVPGYPLVYDYH